jgi:prepilin-type N-terminal cleavage/methylation domain-containing protein
MTLSTDIVRRARSAFSLLELLVVLAIIGVFMAFLLPMLAAARDAAKSTVCLSNLRQLGFEVTDYAHNHDDCFPGDCAFKTDLNRWTENLKAGGDLFASYDTHDAPTSFLRCPAIDSGVYTRGSYPNGQTILRLGTDYGLNEWLVYGAASAVADGTVSFAYKHRLTRIKDYQNLLLGGDSGGWNHVSGTVGWAGTILQKGDGSADGYLGCCERRHGSKSNAKWNGLYCDGHAESFLVVAYDGYSWDPSMH